MLAQFGDAQLGLRLLFARDFQQRLKRAELRGQLCDLLVQQRHPTLAVFGQVFLTGQFGAGGGQQPRLTLRLVGLLGEFL